MNEVRALIEAFDLADVRGERCALATVVSVEGSSYRRPGARMLVREAGTWTGTISAGCLEGDVIEHAMGVMETGAAKLVEYDTASTGDEMAWGLGLGCNGIVRVLVEPVAAGSLYIEALRRSCEARPAAAPVSVATVYQTARLAPEPESEAEPVAARITTGARLVLDGQGNVRHEKLSGETAARLAREVRALKCGGVTSAARVHDIDGRAGTARRRGRRKAGDQEIRFRGPLLRAADGAG